MHIHGTYINGKGQTVSVKIVTGGSTSSEIEIGDNGVYFTDEPMEITSEMNDTFDVLLPHSATIRLYTDRHIPELYTALCMNSPVNISIDGVCVFAGFVEPLSYSQPFVSVADEIEINCVDCLSALQYSNFKDIGAAGVDYNTVKAAAGKATFWNIITDILQPVYASANISSGTVRVLYDGSKAVDNTSANHYNIFTKLSISELLFLGDDEDDVDTQEDVLTELLRYLNLHIEQRGFDFYIFDWATLKGSGSVTWKNLLTNSNVTQTRSTTALNNNIVSDDNTTIEIGEVFNRVEVTADITKVENVVDGIFDEDHLTSPYNSNDLYKTHVIYDKGKKGVGRADNYRKLCQAARERSMDFFDIDLDGKATVTEYYVRIMKSDNWIFPKLGDQSTDLVDYFCGAGSTPNTILNWLGTHIGACVLKLGKAEWKPDMKDNSPTSKISWETLMYIGKDYQRIYNQNHTSWEPKAVTEEELLASCPIAVYNGNRLGARISPVDDDTVNYIVITGKIAMLSGDHMPQEDSWNIAAQTSGNAVYSRYRDNNGEPGFTYPLGGSLERPANEDNCHAACGLWERSYSSTTGYSMTPVRNNSRVYDASFWQQGMGILDSVLRGEFKYKHSHPETESQDTVSKIPVLACMLRIGDKVAVEYPTFDGNSYDFQWQTYKPLDECEDIDEYYQQVIFIGFDPKTDDFVLNQEYEISNNVNVDMNIDKTGMAIPVRRTDNVSGDVHFEILGMVNMKFNDAPDGGWTRRNDTWFRPYTRPDLPYQWKDVLPRVKGVALKKLEIEMVSDNGQFDPIDDKDLVYVSDTDESYVNKNDGTSFRVTSDLTTAEAAALGVQNYVKLSAPYNGDDAVTSIYDHTKNTTAKPEQLWVDSYWQEYHQPRIVMEQGMESDMGRLDHITHPALSGKTFYITGRDIIADGTVKLKLKEIES